VCVSVCTLHVPYITCIFMTLKPLNLYSYVPDRKIFFTVASTNQLLGQAILVRRHLHGKHIISDTTYFGSQIFVIFGIGAVFLNIT
jgi:hypothetical protein